MTVVKNGDDVEAKLRKQAIQDEEKCVEEKTWTKQVEETAEFTNSSIL